jgi:hypothetical protein
MATGSANYAPQLQFNPALVDAFDRHTILDNTRIVSRCKKCGVSFVGSVMNGHADKEREHMEWCSALFTAASSSPPSS